MFTTEAEYMALSTSVKECLWIIQLLRDMNLTKYLEDSLNQVDIKENFRQIYEGIRCMKEVSV